MKQFYYGNEKAKTVLIQMTDDHEREGLESETTLIRDLAGTQDFFFCACGTENWNRDLSPWEAPPVFGKEGFAGDAEKTLARLLNEVIPDLPGGTEGRKFIIGGYSLAGLFALWAVYQTGLFSGAAAASPSVWFPGFTVYAKEKQIRAKAVYLSLGDREEKTRNPVMAGVGNAVRELASYYADRPSLNSVLEWNSGNHFQDAALRTAKAFAWTLNRVRQIPA